MIGLSPFYPVPGLRGFTATEQFDSLGARRCCGSALYPWNRSLSTGTMVTAFRLARLSNLKKSLRRSAMETKVLSLIEQEKKLFTITKEPPAGERIVPVPDMDEELVRRVMFS
jgi:hypothetical protein